MGNIVQGGVIPSLNIGGQVFTDLSTIIVLVGYVNSNKNFSFRKLGSSSGYIVTALKTLTIKALRAMSTAGASTTNASATMQLLYSDNDVGMDSATAFTNAVYETGSATSFAHANATISDSHPNEFGGLNFQVLAGKIPGGILSSAVTSNFMVWGYES